MEQNLDELSEAELAEWQYAHREELDSEEGDLVDVEVSPQLSVTMSFRLPGVEADAIREAAHSADLSLSEWIRQACADALEPEDGRRRRVEVELKRARRQLDVTRKQVEAAQRANRRMIKSSRGNKSNAKSAPASSSDQPSTRKASE